MYIHIYVYMCVYICLYLYLHLYICIYIYMCVCIYIHTYTCVGTDVRDRGRSCGSRVYGAGVQGCMLQWKTLLEGFPSRIPP